MLIQFWNRSRVWFFAVLVLFYVTTQIYEFLSWVFETIRHSENPLKSVVFGSLRLRVWVYFFAIFRLARGDYLDRNLASLHIFSRQAERPKNPQFSVVGVWRFGRLFSRFFVSLRVSICLWIIIFHVFCIFEANLHLERNLKSVAVFGSLRLIIWNKYWAFFGTWYEGLVCTFEICLKMFYIQIRICYQLRS